MAIWHVVPLRFAPAFRALEVCDHSWLRYHNIRLTLFCLHVLFSAYTFVQSNPRMNLIPRWEWISLVGLANRPHSEPLPFIIVGPCLEIGGVVCHLVLQMFNHLSVHHRELEVIWTIDEVTSWKVEKLRSGNCWKDLLSLVYSNNFLEVLTEVEQSFDTANQRFSDYAAAQNFSAILLAIQIAATERIHKIKFPQKIHGVSEWISKNSDPHTCKKNSCKNWIKLSCDFKIYLNSNTYYTFCQLISTHRNFDFNTAELWFRQEAFRNFNFNTGNSISTNIQKQKITKARVWFLVFLPPRCILEWMSLHYCATPCILQCQ